MIDTESERWAIGAALDGPEQLPAMVGIVQPEHFSEHYRAAWDAITVLHGRGEPVNTSSVAYEMATADSLANFGGMALLTDLARECPVASAAALYAGAVRQAADRRKVYNTAMSIATWARDLTPEDAIAQGMDALMALVAQGGDRMTMTADEVLRDGLDSDLEEFIQDPRALRGLGTGLTKLDDMLGGLQRGGVYLFGAETSLGKSLFVQDRTRYWALQGLRVMVFTTEMSANQVGWRTVFQLAGLDSYRLRRLGAVTPEQRDRIRAAFVKFATLPVHFCDRGNLSVAHLLNEVRKLRARWGGLDVVVIDHIDMVRGERGKGSKTQELEDTTGALKALARDEDVPVIEVSHLNRVNMASATNRNSRFRNSESKPQDADVAMFLAPVNADGSEMSTDEARGRMSNPGLLQVRLEITKNRWGPTGNVPLWLNWQQGGRFIEWSPEVEP